MDRFYAFAHHAVGGVGSGLPAVFFVGGLAERSECCEDALPVVGAVLAYFGLVVASGIFLGAIAICFEIGAATAAAILKQHVVCKPLRFGLWLIEEWRSDAIRRIVRHS